MKISTKGRYALRMMLDLAQHDSGQPVALKEISARQEISVKYLEQIVTQLSRAGLLKSSRGAQGGYQLAKSPCDYRIGDILRVTEGSLEPVPCLDGQQSECARSADCLAQEFWKGLSQAINEYVDSVTLEELANRHGGCEYMI